MSMKPQIMKTYTQALRHRAFNWRKALKAHKYPSLLRLKAGDWVTCACGNQCDAIPRDSTGKPIDRTLMELGYRFYQEVGWEHWALALFTLDLIEERSKRILEEMETL